MCILSTTKVLCLVIAICFAFNCIPCLGAENYNQEDVIAVLFEEIMPKETELVYRGDCVRVIVQLLGVFPLQGAVAWWYVPKIYVEQDVDRANNGYIIMGYSGGIVQGRNGYSIKYHSIFEPFEYVTQRECLAIMLRCLYEPAEIEWENVEKIAYDANLLTETEFNEFDNTKKLDYATFKLLLERMLCCKRYLYYSPDEREPGTTRGSYFNIDKNKQITYLEWILQPGTDTEPHWIYDRILKKASGQENELSEEELRSEENLRRFQSMAKQKVMKVFEENYAQFDCVKNSLINLVAEYPSMSIIAEPDDKGNPFVFMVGDVNYFDLEKEKQDPVLIDNISKILDYENLVKAIHVNNNTIDFRIWGDRFMGGITYSITGAELKAKDYRILCEMENIGGNWYYYRSQVAF